MLCADCLAFPRIAEQWSLGNMELVLTDHEDVVPAGCIEGMPMKPSPPSLQLNWTSDAAPRNWWMFRLWEAMGPGRRSHRRQLGLGGSWLQWTLGWPKMCCQRIGDSSWMRHLLKQWLRRSLLLAHLEGMAWKWEYGWLGHSCCGCVLGDHSAIDLI
jgi:hypothetical protein